MRGRGALMSSASDEWRTPESVLGRVRELGPIELDPCTTSSNPCGARAFYTSREDGLAQPWGCSRSGMQTSKWEPWTVYCNPPYSRLLEWCVKAAAEAEEPSTRVVLLIPARTDTRAWDVLLSTQRPLVCLVRGRLHFSGAKNGAPFPSALVGLNVTEPSFARAFRPLGHLLQPIRYRTGHTDEPNHLRQ